MKQAANIDMTQRVCCPAYASRLRQLTFNVGTASDDEFNGTYCELFGDLLTARAN